MPTNGMQSHDLLKLMKFLYFFKIYFFLSVEIETSVQYYFSLIILCFFPYIYYIFSLIYSYLISIYRYFIVYFLFSLDIIWTNVYIANLLINQYARHMNVLTNDWELWTAIRKNKKSNVTQHRKILMNNIISLSVNYLNLVKWYTSNNKLHI